METKTDISVIIPMYNSEKYIETAINSILTQEEHGFNYEVIIVDDGSTDNSSQVVKNIKNEKIKLLILEKNGGLSNARNSGMKVAKGEWIQFLDSDDTIGKDLYKKFEMSRKPGFNCYLFSFIREQYNCNLKQTITQVKDKRAFAHFGGTACNKFIKRDICVEFKKDYYSEDVCFSIDMMNEKELKIALIEDAYYFYNKKNEMSLTSNFNKEQFYSMYSYAFSQIDKSDDYTKMFILEIFVATLFDKAMPFYMRLQIATKTLLKLFKYLPRVIVNQNRSYIKNIRYDR